MILQRDAMMDSITVGMIWKEKGGRLVERSFSANQTG
jgi:hypothetical protein